MAQRFSLEVATTASEFDILGQRVLQQARDFGLHNLTGCSASKLFFLEGELASPQIEELARALLVDPVTEELVETNGSASLFVDVALLPGVTDTEGARLLQAARDLGFETLRKAGRGKRYHFFSEGQINPDALAQFVNAHLANEVIEVWSMDEPLPPPFLDGESSSHRPELISLSGLDEAALLRLSEQLQLALDAQEMLALQAHYAGLEREPTRCELETFAQTWSEHCVHKTFRAEIQYTEGGQTFTVDGLLPILRQTTEDLACDWVVSAFVDNAGIVKFHPEWNIALKAETHNHPSALEPFGGANTGVGGVIRDILGVSARPFANWDVLCFGPLDAEPPKGTLPPGRVMQGVIDGIADYGNKMGIPTVAGAVVFHRGYLSNPLVYCGCLGILPVEDRPKEVMEGDRIVLLGGKTGRDGLGGATFSSLEMNSQTMQDCGTAVQIGHPIAEKIVGDLLLEARHRDLYNGVTDCGAGGLASAIGEMAQSLGAKVYLDRVPLKYEGLSPREIWLSEAQERMVVSVPEHNWQALKDLAADYETVCVDLGTFGNPAGLELFYRETRYAELDIHFLHKGLPRRKLDAFWNLPVMEEKPVTVDPKEALLTLLAHPNICSREPVIRRYDHEVQGGTAVKPVTGGLGPADGVALVPLEVQEEEDPPAVVLGCGLWPELTEIDPRLGTLAALDEAIRNIVAVGADPAQISLLDNFSWGNPKLPDRLGKLTRSVLACAEGSKLFRAPFVSGKDSLNNEFREEDGSRTAIPGTILITAVGKLPRVSLRVTAELKAAGNSLYLLGPRSTALGGSCYLRCFDGSSAELPQMDLQAPKLYAAYHHAVLNGLVASCHDVSEGGVAVALAEACLSGGLGAEVTVPGQELFSEGPCRFLVEINPEHRREFENLLHGFPLREIGTVSAEPRLDFLGGFSLSLDEIKRAFERDHFAPLGGSRERAKEQIINPVAVAPTVFSKPGVAILTAPGTNRELDAARAVQAAGGRPTILHLSEDGTLSLKNYAMVILPGGFTFGDDLGAGKLWALGLQRLQEEFLNYGAEGGAVLGICNGFQALLRSGLLLSDGEQATLTHNASDHFECRLVDLEVKGESKSVFTSGLKGVIRCPVAHGEGRFVASPKLVEELVATHRVPLTYLNSGYPANPNGSHADIAALCNRQGNVMGLMPHPENNIYSWQAGPKEQGVQTGLALFTNALRNLT